MSLEIVNTIATLGTFVVIAATAMAALVQLRHMRSSNQIACLNELHNASQTPEFVDAQHFVTTELRNKMKDPDFRFQLNHRQARTGSNQVLIAKILMLGNYFDGMGLLMKTGFVDRQLTLDTWSGVALALWEEMAPAAAIIRRTEGDAGWENFEYVAVLAQDWLAAHPQGDYPAGVRRIGLKDVWLEADKKFAASLAKA
jgi:hypothetical protein